MPITDTHRQYRLHEPQWTRCRDTIAGTDAVKQKGTEYLPKLDGQTAAEYDAYRKRANFYNATRRTIGGLRGSVMRRRPEVSFPEDSYLDSVTLDGDSFDVLALDVLDELLSVGRIGLLVDAPSTGAALPYIATYTAENIRNWQTAVINGRRQMVQVVLRETREVPGSDEFEREEEIQYRVLELVKVDSGMRYQQRLFRQVKTLNQASEQWVEVGREQLPDGTVIDYPYAPSKRGAAFDYIPWVTINPTDLSPDVAEPPLVDMVDVNLSHYRTSADLEHGAHYTALPTAWVAGFEGTTKLRIGSSTAWVSDKTDAKAGFLEFRGQGLNALRELMDDKERMMAVLGSRMLEDQKKAAEAEGTMKLRTAYESGGLVSIAKMAGEGLQEAMRIVAEWGALQTQDIQVKFNTDFVAARLAPNELATLTQALQAGTITEEIYMWNLEQGEMLPPGMTASVAAEKLEMADPFGEPERDDEVNVHVVPGGGGGR